MEDLSDTGADCIESLERPDEGTGREHLDFDLTAAREPDRFRQPNRAGLQSRQAFRPVSHHFEF